MKIKRIKNQSNAALLRLLGLVGIRKSHIYKALGKSKLPSSQQRLLEIMRKDNQAAGVPFSASPQWTQLNREFDDAFRVEGIKQVETQPYNIKFFGAVPGNTKYHRFALWMLYRNLKERDKYDILGRCQANITANPRRIAKSNSPVYVFDGITVSWDLLTAVDALLAIAEVNDSFLTEPVIIVDLGSGWGRMGHVLNTINPSCTYIACDLPEGLLISSSYLPTLLPGQRVFRYDETRAVPRFTKSLLSQGGLWFCGPQSLPRFDDGIIDIFINTSSFQEMTKAQVTAYLHLIDRKVRGVFYTQQYWKSPAFQLELGGIAGIEDYAFPDTWQRHYLRDATFSERYFEAAFSVGV